MNRFPRPAFAIVALLVFAAITHGDEPKPCVGPNCVSAAESWFAREVWTKIGSQSCLTCHKAGGDAEKSEFVLRDPRRAEASAQNEVQRHNRDAFLKIARVKEGDDYRLLLKATGRLDHGGQDVLKPNSTGYGILAEFVRRVNAPPSEPASAVAPPVSGPPFFEGVLMLEDRRLLRRVSLSLVGRLPTADELAVVEKDGALMLPDLMDRMMREDAFYERLREAFNDIFLTVGYADGAESALSYEHFSTTRHWTQQYDLSHIKDERARLQAGYKLANDYRAALFGEPMKLVEHIVRNDRPFTEIITADYIMVSPYTARGYGIFEKIQDRFKNPEDPFEYIPVSLPALVGRNKSQNQESATGNYPHAGLLSTFQYLRRYPTTETNRNRLRARMYMQHFLGVDALELAARVSDAAEATAKYEIPTMQAAECVVCHRTIDPIAGVFQDYSSFEGVFGPRKEGWYQDMFGPGFEGEDLPKDEKWRSLPWLGERTAKDPRFAVAMVEHGYYVLTGRKVLLAPKELDDPLYAARRRAYDEQRREIDRIAAAFAKSNFNFKAVLREWVLSDFYRADGLATAVKDPARLAELNDVGVVRLLSPEQIERKVEAIFGERWGRLTEQLAMLYGGIDSQEVTERAADPSGAMGAIQRTLANDVACNHTLRDFVRPAAERKLFPHVEPDVVPGKTPEGDAAIRKTLVHLHDRVLGRYDALDSPEIDRSFQLFSGIVEDARQQKGLDPRENYFCRHKIPDAPNDKEYTVRAWRGVLTYLLRRQEFLYE